MSESQLVAQLESQPVVEEAVPNTGDVGFAKSSWGSAC